MRPFFIYFITFLITTSHLHAQVGINTDKPNAVLDIRASTNPEESGILIPKLSDYPTVTAAQDGMMIFIDGTGTPTRGFYFYTDGMGWTSVGGSSGGTLDQAYNFGGAGAGNVITATDGAVTIAGEDGLTVSGTLNTGEDVGTPGAGVRMFFNPRRAAFRAGRVNGNQWDAANIGSSSVAFGVNNTARGAGTFAAGVSNNIQGGGSIAMGDGNTSSGDLNIALGTSNLTDEEGSIAIGSNNQSDAEYSISIGDDNTASNESSLAIGFSNTSSGRSGITLGNNLEAASGYETVLGRYNTTYTPNSTSGFDTDDRLFTVGNGTSNANRNDALTIKKNGLTGINTSNPQGALHVETINNTGFVLPRVTSVDDVTDGQGNPPLEGTAVYDLSRQKTCFYNNGKWSCISYDSDTGSSVLTTPNPYDFVVASYIKSSNSDVGDQFGRVSLLSGDGNTMAVSAYTEDSNATGINGDQTDNTNTDSGAVYIFHKQSGSWILQGYIKASNSSADDEFGWRMAISADGNTLAVGAHLEDSNSRGVNGVQNDIPGEDSGAVYVFSRSGTNWTQQAFLKSSNSDSVDNFGSSVDLSDSGNTLIVGASSENSNATGVNGDQSNNDFFDSGAAYIFERTGSTWVQSTYLKASNTGINDEFGGAVAISGNGNTILVIARGESSNAVGINGDQSNNSVNDSGAGYVFIRNGITWTQQAYIKHSFTLASGNFGGDSRAFHPIDFSYDGNTLAIGSSRDNTNATGVNGTVNATINSSGSVSVFVRNAAIWTQESYIKPAIIGVNYRFGNSVSLSADGNKLLVGMYVDFSNATGISSVQDTDSSAAAAGAAFTYTRNSSQWIFESYIKPEVIDGQDFYGISVSLSNNGESFCIGAHGEDGNGTLFSGNPTSNTLNGSGALWLYEN